MVIGYHNRMRAEGRTEGRTWEKIQEVVKQYCDQNKLDQLKAKNLLHELVDHKELYLEEMQRKKPNQILTSGVN